MPTNKGFAAIAPIIIIGGLILAITSGAALRARKQVVDDVGIAQGEQALYIAHACAEIAIGKLQTAFGYMGNEVVNSEGITCTILPITGVGNFDRTVTTNATISGHKKSVQVTVTQISSPTVISSWKEISN